MLYFVQETRNATLQPNRKFPKNSERGFEILMKPVGLGLGLGLGLVICPYAIAIYAYI